MHIFFSFALSCTVRIGYDIFKRSFYHENSFLLINIFFFKFRIQNEIFRFCQFILGKEFCKLDFILFHFPSFYKLTNLIRFYCHGVIKTHSKRPAFCIHNLKTSFCTAINRDNNENGILFISCAIVSVTMLPV